MPHQNIVNWQNQHNSEFQVDVLIDNYESVDEFVTNHYGHVVLMFLSSEPWCLDGYRVDFLLEAIKIMKHKGQTPVVIQQPHFTFKHLDYGCETHVMDWTVRHIYESFYKRTTHRNARWNADNNQMLLLTGAINKPQRCRLLYLMHEAGVLQQSIYSCFYKDQWRELIKDMVPEVEPEWFDTISQSPDVPQTEKFNTETSRFQWGSPQSGFPGQYASMAEQCSFAVVSESDFNDYEPLHIKWRADYEALRGDDWSCTTYEQFLHKIKTEFPDVHRYYQYDFKRAWRSEKIYMPIANRLPFIVAGDRGFCKHLQELGYVTFDEYLPEPYDNLKGEHRLKAVVNCAAGWLDHIPDMTDAVEHNYQTFIKRQQQDHAFQMQTCERFGLEPTYENAKLIFPIWPLSAPNVKNYRTTS